MIAGREREENEPQPTTPSPKRGLSAVVNHLLGRRVPTDNDDEHDNNNGKEKPLVLNILGIILLPTLLDTI